MEGIRVLIEKASIFNLQKLRVSDECLPATSHGKIATVVTPDDTFCLCQIYLCKTLNPSCCTIDTSVRGFCKFDKLYPVKKTLRSISVSNIDIIESIENIKSLTVSIVFSAPAVRAKWRNKNNKLCALVKDILTLFIIKTGSLISMEGVKSLFDVSIDHVLVESTGSANVGRVVNFTKVRVSSTMSQITFEQIHSVREDPIVLGGLDAPRKTLTDLVLAASSQNQRHTYKQVLLVGPPGCGKTALVGSVARECGTVLRTVTGPELGSPQPGEAERALARVFEECTLLAQESPGGCVLLVEQVEVLVGRDASCEGHVIRLANHLLSLLEGVDHCPGLLVVGTTSQPQAILPAARRPGHFGTEIHVPVSSESERASILRALTRQRGLSDSPCDVVARWTPGFVGADLALLASQVTRHLAKLGLSVDYDEEELVGHWRRCVGRQTASALRGQVGVVALPPGAGAGAELGGVAHVWRSLVQAVQWPLTHPEAFRRLGLPPPKGVLLYGPPGCAKTSLVRALAAAAHTTFLAVSAACVYSPYVGEAERTVAELFHRARTAAPAILFIDEIDALVGSRSGREKGSQERILSAFLTEMDGVGVRLDSGTAQGGVVVVAATNRPEVLDPALTRPGRFDRIIYVGPPDTAQRLDILHTITSKMPLGEDVDLASVAEQTQRFSGADLAQLCKEAGLAALTEDGMSAEQIRHCHWSRALRSMRPSLPPTTGFSSFHCGL